MYHVNRTNHCTSCTTSSPLTQHTQASRPPDCPSSPLVVCLHADPSALPPSPTHSPALSQGSFFRRTFPDHCSTIIKPS